MSDRYHFVPTDDLKEHITSGTYCHCAPALMYDGDLVVHNSYDGREFFEAENCEHEWEWVGGHGTPYGATEPEQVCKHCGMINPDD